MIQLLLYLATIPAANWMIGNVGTACLPQGPCLVPVGFGLTAPSGVLVIGIALVLRDLVHRDLGARWAAAGVAAGSAMSFAIASPALAVASFVAFAVSEALDQAVYTPLRRRRLALAVLASGIVGAVADSALFLWLAFGSLDHVAGQIVGKLWMVGAAAGFLCLRSRRHPAVAAP
jgi:uncharacterized PurR-regulated membrane protein YhhQ (DUF165 family)